MFHMLHDFAGLEIIMKTLFLLFGQTSLVWIQGKGRKWMLYWNIERSAQNSEKEPTQNKKLLILNA